MPLRFLPPLTDDPARRLGVIDVLLPLLACTVLHLINLGRGLYIDEYTTWRVIQAPVDELIRERSAAGHLPGYFLLMKHWCAMVGHSEVDLRLPSMFQMLAAVGLFAPLAAALIGRRAGLAATWLLALHQLTIWSGQTARPYCTAVLASIIVLVLLRHWLLRGGWLALPAMLLTMIVGLTVQPLFATFVVALLLTMLIGLRRNGRGNGAVVAVIAAAGVIVVPLFSLLAREQQNYNERRIGFPLRRLLDGFTELYFGDFGFISRNTLFEIFVQIFLGAHLLLIGALLWRLRRRRGSRFPTTALLISWLAIPLVVLTLAAGTGARSVLSHQRYFAIILPAVCLMAGLGTVLLERWLVRRRPRLAPVAWLPYAAALCFTVAWLKEQGDGPKLLVARIGAPALIVGDGQSMRYEYRRVPDTRVIDTKGGDVSTLLQQVEEDEFWLVIYDNHKTPHDPWYKEPVPGWTILRREKVKDARAAHYRRLAE